MSNCFVCVCVCCVGVCVYEETNLAKTNRHRHRYRQDRLHKPTTFLEEHSRAYPQLDKIVFELIKEEGER